jgi:hypothetical protein
VTTSPVDLVSLFAAAQEAIASHQQEINDLDGYNGNHGDNMAQNMQMIVETLQQRRDQPPSAALEQASQRLRAEGRGGTSQYYAQGLGQAARQLQGRSEVSVDDALSMIQSLLGAIPNQGHPQGTQTGGSVLDQVLGMSQGQPAQQAQTSAPRGGLLKALIPAALAFFRATQSGADSPTAVSQALTSALTGSQPVNPLQSGTPRAAAGGLVAQSLLQALMGGR